MKNLLTKDIDEFNMLLYDLANHPTVQKMKLFRHIMILTVLNIVMM